VTILSIRRTRLTCLAVVAALWSTACDRAKDNASTPPPAAETKTDKSEISLSPAEQATASFEIKTAALSSEAETLQANGRIALADDRMWRVGVRTDGIVVEVYAQLGQFVKKGDILARYHADEVRESRAQYRAALSELQRAKAVTAQAMRNRDRAQRLLELRAGSQQQVEQTQEDVARAEADVRRAEIEIDRTRDVLEDDLRVPAEPHPDDPLSDDVPIFAPQSGYVIQKNVTPGKTVNREMDTFVLGDLSKVWMLASIHQENLGSLRIGQSVTVTLPGDLAGRYQGRITNLGQQFDPETRLAEIRIELSNPNNRLRPEMLANAEIPVGTGKPIVTVPSDAIQQVNGQDVVFVRIAPERFATHVVRTGETAEGRTPILEGVKAGDSVVTHGGFILKSKLLKSTLESE
jgi:cobalt-zinc-cadmium efflux system membrane fusion protein